MLGNLYFIVVNLIIKERNSYNNIVNIFWFIDHNINLSISNNLYMIGI